LTISPELADTIAKADEYEFASVRNVTPEPETPKTNPFAKKPKGETLLVDSPADDDAWLPETSEKEEVQ
jgi:hypothetical protein